MKKYIYLLIFSFAALVACDSTEELYDELDSNDAGLRYEIEYTLNDDDYEWLSDTYEVASFGNFESEDEAREYIPFVLENEYPQFGRGSSALITYNLYDPITINNATSHTLTEEDYDAIGETYGNLSSQGDITRAAAHVSPDAEENDVLTLTYEWYASGTTTTQTSKVVYYQSSWMIAYIPTAADYTYMGQSYPNFESRSTGRARIAVLFDNLFPFAEEGDVRTSVFQYYNGTSASDFLAVFQFNGANWAAIQDEMPQALQFGNDGTTWVPDNTIRYLLATADYAAIAANPELGNPTAQANLASFGNFNTNGGYWTTEEIIEAIGYVLLTNFPESEVGQQYMVTYNTYPGGNLEVHLILTEEGTYMVVEN